MPNWNMISSLIHSDEGLTLETSVFESLAVANLPLIIYFSVSLSHRRSTQFLLKLNPLCIGDERTYGLLRFKFLHVSFLWFV